MRGDTLQMPWTGTIRVHQWTPRSGPLIKAERPPQHRGEKPVVPRTGDVKSKILEALGEVPTGMTCASICQAKRLMKKSAEMSITKLLKNGEIRIAAYERNRFNRNMRVYALVAA